MDQAVLSVALHKKFYNCNICKEDVYGRAEILMHHYGMDSVHDILSKESIEEP